MTTIQDIISNIDSNLITRYKNLTGDTDELFERMAAYLIKGYSGLPIDETIKKLGRKQTEEILIFRLTEELEAFGG